MRAGVVRITIRIVQIHILHVNRVTLVTDISLRGLKGKQRPTPYRELFRRLCANVALAEFALARVDCINTNTIQYKRILSKISE